MAEKHKIYSAGSGFWRDFLYSMYDFVQNQQSGIVQFATDGATKAIWDGSGYITPTAATDFGNDSYIVIEPVTASQDGTRWQAKIIADSNAASGSASYGVVVVSFSGGWSTTNASFASTTTVVSGEEQICINALDGADSFYFSVSSTDSWTNSAGTQTYTYFRALNWDQSQTENNKLNGMYCGGYIPADVEDNQRPCVLLCRYAQVLDVSYSWGDLTATEDYCLVPGNYTHTSGGGINAGFCGTGNGTGAVYYSISPDGHWVNAPMLLTDYSANRVVGAFGKYTMLHGHSDRSTGSADSLNEYLVSQAIMLRWKPSA